jgi:hypothetical protein
MASRRPRRGDALLLTPQLPPGAGHLWVPLHLFSRCQAVA